MGRASSSWSLRLNGAALAWRAKSGLKTIYGALRAGSTITRCRRALAIAVRGYVHEAEIACGTYEGEDLVFDPPYLALIEQKINALDQAAPLAGWRLPERYERGAQRQRNARCHQCGELLGIFDFSQNDILVYFSIIFIFLSSEIIAFLSDREYLIPPMWAAWKGTKAQPDEPTTRAETSEARNDQNFQLFDNANQNAKDFPAFCACYREIGIRAVAAHRAASTWRA